MQQHLATYSNLTLKSNKPIPLFKARDCDQLTLDFLAYRERYSNIRFIKATLKSNGLSREQAFLLGAHRTQTLQCP